MKDYQIDPKVATFFERLERLDAGGRARLKRCAGQSLLEARRETVGLFYSLLPPNTPQIQEDTFFLAATLFPLAENGKGGDLGYSLRQARQSKNSKGLDRRVEILLDADETQLSFRLRQAIHFLKSRDVRVNFPRLLDDLLWWSHPEGRVQRRWAKSYFTE